MIPSYVKTGIIDLENFRERDFDLHTAVTCLSRINRFSGHTHYPYSVAQHAVVVSYLVPEWAAAVALHHDTSEAYVGDCPGPIKHLLPKFAEIEDRIAATIYAALRLPYHPEWPAAAYVKNADKWALRLEQQNLQGRVSFYDWEPRFEPQADADLDSALDVLELELSPDEARKLFMRRHFEVCL